eukprot:TRINITY_DN5298_c0_g2_i1.p1 TRINITY_DN5298_c0_g2~~TRINITY_DN5298_c0_g2_i1.p1  ORF type:complete len:181 (-),score=18.13 TRINITY_DN5298_c0_g2_i1:79-621(-)
MLDLFTAGRSRSVAGKTVTIVIAFLCARGGMSAESCLQKNLLFGTNSLAAAFADVCCRSPQRFAEPAGSLDKVQFWSTMDQQRETTFFDSKCGKPLFIAPRNRTFDAFKQESQRHGWPSFRDTELVKENIVIKTGGEVVSSCGTHLGHNLPDQSGNRYCIDLICIAGNPNPRAVQQGVLP